ncbi:probable GPI-anchored adhesin-like protein PGA55 [Benincasa hispida]|uniref:probable GPI-anchored adhesin-like protein PGA55 n=1 Tax=Benincasa hispida TaxID=102211 RepID=UPI001900A814|nr:probable GPI-anchored adhesin-like protein PGA55 [Benincasa hispida]XP_038898870.1 probable GPI-anchored adhesin-like protein PGA55 [Benincasa hispida]
MADMDLLADIPEVNEKCALDMSTYHNLPKPCNAPSLHSPSPIPKDDTDASYVFVTSSDAATSDLNGQPKCSQNVDTEVEIRNRELNTDVGTKPESIFVSDALKDSQFEFSEHVKESDAIQDDIRVADVLPSFDAKVDEAEPGLDSSQTVEDARILEDQTINESFAAETNSGEIHGIQSPPKFEDNRIQEENQIISPSVSSNTDANCCGEIEVESSQMAEDIQNHEDNRIVEIMKSSDTETNHVMNIEAESSQEADGIQIHKENGTVAIKFSDTRSNPREEIEVESSPKADDNQNHEETGVMKASSDTEANPRSEIEVESSREVEDIELQGQNEVVDAIKSSATVEKREQEGEVIPEYNETVAINELSDTIHNGSEETEMESFKREEGIQESEDASLEAADCHCVNSKEKVDEMVDEAVTSDPVGGMGESQIISMHAAKSDLDYSDDSVEDVKGERTSGVVLNEENSKRTQFSINQDGEHYQVVGEEQESLNSEVSVLEPSEENKVDVEQHLAAAPSPLVSSEDINGPISISTEDGLPTSMDQDDPLETIDDKDTVANRTSFHNHNESSSGSVDCDIATVETHRLSPRMLISDPINEITVNDEQEVNHVLELEDNSEMASHPKVEECLKVEVLEGMVSGNGDEVPTAFDESRIFSGDNFVAGSQLITKDTAPVESIDSAVSAVVIGNTSIEIRERASTNCPSDPIVRSDLDVEDCKMSEIVASAGDVGQPDKEVGENHEVGFLGNSNFETKCENGHVEIDHQATFHSNDCSSIECQERGSSVPEVSNGVDKSSVIQLSSTVATDSELHDNGSSSSPTANEKSGDGIKIPSSIEGGSRNIYGDDCSVSKTEVLKGSIVNDERNLNSMSDVVSETDDKPATEETRVIHEGCQNEPSPISPEGGSGDTLMGQNVGAEAGTRPFNFLVKVPRFDDKNIREQIKRAQTEVDWKTKDRDAIRVQIQTMRAAWKVLSDDLEAAVSEGRAARDLLKSKRLEIDSVQSVITKVKNAMSVEDIDGRIRNIEHTIEHETLPLKEEKQLIREIKQLKQLREQLSSTMGKQDELQQALDQKDQIEERLKLLRKEMDLLRDNVLKAESAIKAAKKKYNDESIKLGELQSQFKAADKIRQEAYANLQSMRKQLYEKNKYCWKYRDEAKEANEIASSRDLEKLQHFCVNQVERMMELWNTNAEFREEYIKSNTRSTLRRLKTLDGRSLGPNEEPQVLNLIVKEEGSVRDNSLSTVSTTQESEKLIPADDARDNDKSETKVAGTKNQMTKRKKPEIVLGLVNDPRNISSENEVEEAPRPEEIKRTREEEELAVKAEELRKEEEAMKLKEQRKLEEKAKAKEALERKKRNAEKAQARAVIKARKEAEEREKLREKRAKKKERKMAAETEGGNGWDERESGLVTETPSESSKEESENTGKQGMAVKRPQKVSQYTKQSKTKSIPPPLRNRGKRRMQPWMWVLLTIVFVFALFFVGQQRLLY